MLLPSIYHATAYPSTEVESLRDMFIELMYYLAVSEFGLPRNATSYLMLNLISYSYLPTPTYANDKMPPTRRLRQVLLAIHNDNPIKH